MEKYSVRNALPEEFGRIGELMVEVYSGLDGFPKPEEQPQYYEVLRTVGDFTKNASTELLVVVDSENTISGAVVFFSDMSYYGSGGIATLQKNSSGFRLLAVDPRLRGRGLGKMLTSACIEKAKLNHSKYLIIHTTMAMERAWKMYEDFGFKRSTDLDFLQGNLQVFGFRLTL